MWWDGVGLPRLLGQMLRQNPVLRPSCPCPSSWSSSGWRPCLSSSQPVLCCFPIPSLYCSGDWSPGLTSESYLLLSGFLLASTVLNPAPFLGHLKTLMVCLLWLACVTHSQLLVFRNMARRREASLPWGAWALGFCGVSFTATLRWGWGLFWEKRNLRPGEIRLSDQ